MAFDLDLAGGSLYVAGKYGKGFRGVANMTGGVLAGLTSATLEAWVRTTDAGTGVQCVIGGANNPVLGVKGGKAYCSSWGPGDQALNPNVLVNDGNWHHIAETIDNATGTKLYVDGVLVGSNTIANIFNTTNLAVGVQWAIGNTFPGDMDDVAVTAGIKYTGNFTPAPVSNMQANLIAVWHFADSGVNSAGIEPVAEPAATAYTLSGPSSGTVGVASGQFTVAVNGMLTGSVTITPAAPNGTFTPASVTLTNDVRDATFTHTAAAAGIRTITTTNNGGLSNPAGVAYTAQTVDNIAPVFVSAQVANANPNIILVTFSEPLAASLPPAGAHVLSGGRTASATSISGSVMSVTVNTPYAFGDTVTYGYTQPGADPRIKDAANNATDTFAAQPVANNVAYVRPAFPTASTTGRRVVKVGAGAGEDFATLDALSTYLTTQTLKANNEILIAEVYKSYSSAGFDFRVPVAQQDKDHYVIIRPVPGRSVSDIFPDEFNYGTEGIEIVMTGEMKVRAGVRVGGFRIDLQNAGVISMGGPGGAVPVATEINDVKGNRIRFSGTGSGMGAGEYEVKPTIEDNLFIDTTGVATVGIGSFIGEFNRNTCVGTVSNRTQPFFYSERAGMRNNAFDKLGPSPYVGNSQAIEGNYTSVAMSSPRAGITVDLVKPFFQSATDFRPATNGALVGNATDAAKSINDIRGGNRGIDPDVGAWQLVAATPLPQGVITGTPVPQGQQLTVPFTTANTPVSATATLVPDTINPGEAISNAGAVTLGSGNGTAVFADIAGGNYKIVIVLSNNGGSSTVTGSSSVSILTVSGAPEAPAFTPSESTAPGAPTSVAITAGNGKITVSFTPPFNTGGKPILNYRIVASNGQEITTSAAPPIDMTIANGTSVSVQVQAINEIGPSALSAPSNIATPAAPLVPPSAPVITSVVAKNKAVVLTFSTPAAGDRPITGYIVSSSSGLSQAVSASPATITVTNGIAATYQVQAVSTAGTGPKSAASTSVTAEVTARVKLNAPPAGTVGLPNLSSLKWSWFDQSNVALLGAPVAKGAVEQTDGTGLLELVLPGSVLNTGQVGWLVVTNSDGNPATGHKAFSGPVEVD